MQLKSKLADVGITIFTIMSQLAREQGAINLSQGFPDFNTNPELIQLVEKYMRAECNQYAPMQGVPQLRERIGEKVSRLYQAEYNPDTEITITAGATEALFAAISAVVQTDDEVIIFEPAYDAYMPVVKLNNGIPRFLKLKFPDYHIDWNEVKDIITSKTKLIILNSPHNPTGTVLSATDMQSLQEVVRDKNIFIISDEVYEHIIFDNLKHESLSGYPELAQRSFVISSFGKTYHTTGWKTGYCLAPARLSAEFQKIHQFLTFAVNTPIQYAYAKILEQPELYLNLAQFYQQKRDLFLNLLDSSRFKILACKGTYFQMLDYSAISLLPDIEFARELTAKYKVAAIPPSVFYHKQDDNKVLRFCFAKKDETLKEAAQILCKI